MRWPRAVETSVITFIVSSFYPGLFFFLFYPSNAWLFKADRRAE